MNKEELYKALKIFNREDLTYENDEFCNDFEEYMNIMKQEKAIEVFMSTEDMIKYSKLDQEIEELNNRNRELFAEKNKLNNIIKEAREYIQDRYDGEVLTHTFDKCNVGELLGILDKGE